MQYQCNYNNSFTSSKEVRHSFYIQLDGRIFKISMRKIDTRYSVFEYVDNIEIKLQVRSSLDLDEKNYTKK